jgi:hypothetical protein
MKINNQLENSLNVNIKNISEIQNIGELNKIEVLTTTNGDYSQTIVFEFWNTKIDLLKDFKKNDNVTISYNIKSNEYKGKYYYSFRGWKIVNQADEVTNAQQSPDRAVNNDLPF